MTINIKERQEAADRMDEIVDKPTLGLLICKTKDNVLAQYALEASSQPLGISEYQLSQLLPEDYKSALPSIEEIEEGLRNMEFENKI